MDLLDRVQRTAIRMIRGMEHLPCEDRLGEVRFNLEKQGSGKISLRPSCI